MRVRHPLVQAVCLIAAALVLAVVANGFASRTRRLMLPGYYPNALKVPAAASTTAPVTTTSITTTAPTATAAPLTTTAPIATTTIATATAPTTTLPPAATTTHAPAPSATTTIAQAPQAPIAQTPPTTPPAPARREFAPHPDKAYVELSGDDVASLHAQGALFLDARRSSVYEEGHIAGARPFSVWESDIDEKVNALFNERPDPADQNKPIVVYCTGGACEDSHMLAEKLWGIQFNNVYVYKDGFPDWQKRNGAVHKGAQP
ncbi:MAG TPA: rhodanese-like domain-containing protein [Thermoanaerobaculia bacterium]|jgi:rhodanese-related sulfurtransferase